MRAIRASASTAPLPFAHRLTATLLLFCARAAHPAEAFATQQPKAILARALVVVQSPKVPRLLIVSPKTSALRASPWVHLARSTSTATRSTRAAAVLPPSATAKHPTAAAAMRKNGRTHGDGGLQLGSGGSGGGGDSGDGGGGSSASLSLPAFLEMSSARGRTQASGGSGGSDANSSSSSNLVIHAFSGNEACDADSICSAICMAFLKQSTAGGGGGGGPGGGGGSDDDVATKEGDGTTVLYVPGECLTLRAEDSTVYEYSR